MKKNYLIIVIILAPFFAGCAVTKLHSIRAPGHSAYNKILVYAKYSNTIRGDYEEAIVMALEDKGIHASRSIDIYSPLRNYTDSAISAIYSKKGFEAMLVLAPNGTSTTTRSEAHENWYGGVSGSSYEDLSGIYTIAVLNIVQSDETVYQASLSTSLGEYTQMSEARRSLATQLVEDLDYYRFLRHPTE